VNLGLPAGVRACLFDMDGVLTETATVHAAAWKATFDEFLHAWSGRHSQAFIPFDEAGDYDRYVDGRSRLDGVRTFLSSRGITLPEGADEDRAGSPTVHGLARRKNDLLLERLRQDGVHVYPGSLHYLRAARAAGLHTAVVSASANTRHVLEAAGIAGEFEARIDGVTARERHLQGKPAPDMYLAAADALHLAPAEAAVFEDALAGVAAGQAGGFAAVIGVDRAGQGEALARSGATRVVRDLAELLT
jgi:beta-phosphoglucomutase family hydrolase